MNYISIFYKLFEKSSLRCGRIFLGIYLFIGQLMGQNTSYLFIGTNTGDVNEGIYTATFSSEDGSFEMIRKYADILNPNYLFLHPNSNTLYAVHGIQGENEGGVSSFTIDERSGNLTFLNRQLSGGNGPCYVSISSNGDWVLVANYVSGSVSLYPLTEEKGIGQIIDVKQHEGTGPDKERQEGPHAHYIQQGPGDIVFASDLGADKVFLYRINKNTQTLEPLLHPQLEVPPGSGPRHVDYHPELPMVYVLNELNGTVSAFRRYEDQDSFALVQTLSTVPDDFKGYNKSADIHIHPDGKFLYASNRGDFNSIATFSIDQKSGILTATGYMKEGIAWPRNFTLDKEGKFILVANRDTNLITSYSIHQKTGALTATGFELRVPKPVCVKLLED